MLLIDSLVRKKRIVTRNVRGKSLPQYVYRWDTRSPDVIKIAGFQPRAIDGDLSVIEHVNNALGSHRSNPEMNAKEYSQFVSTGSYGMLSTIDPVFAQQVLHTNLYKIDTTMIGCSSDFFDVNDVFDRAGLRRPYKEQREWAKINGIPRLAIIEVMTERELMSQYDFKHGSPKEKDLTGWKHI